MSVFERELNGVQSDPTHELALLIGAETLAAARLAVIAAKGSRQEAV
jgi:hypothetical protein